MKKNYKVALFIALAALLAGGLVYYFANGGALNVERNSHENSIEEQDGVNYDPPTQEEVEETDDFKEDQANEEDSDNTDQGSGPEKVTVTLTRVSDGEDVVTVAGYVNNDVDGECELTLVSNAATKKYTNPTEDNPTNPNIVNCSTFRVPKNDLSGSDEWTAQITYRASGASGTSQTWDFNI